ncbi:MAG: alginate export family protein [Bacteroidales bacterium]|nr:alginate export family protein [Bacteroidales bacterium]
MRNITLIIIMLLAAITLKAQLTLNGEYRPRIDFDHGNKTLQSTQNQMFNLQTTQRARLGVFYKAEKYKFGLQIQDVRAWGSSPQLVSNDGFYTTVHQAWGEVLFTENIAVKLGRQELVYDDSRILGNVNWAQQARSHDLALIKYEKEGSFKLHFGLAVNQVQPKPYNTPKNYKSMQFVWFNKEFGNLKLSALVLNNGVEDVVLNDPGMKPMTTYSQIVGVRPVYKMGQFTFAGNFYYQMGKSTLTYNDKSDKKDYHLGVSAYNIRLEAAYKINDNLKATVGFEMLSGNSETDTTYESSKTNKAFSPLYGTNHKFNGWMDYFYVGNHGNTVGLNDMFVMLDYKKDKLLAGAHFHYFMANGDVLDQAEFANSGKITAMSSGLGMELDTYVGYKFDKNILFKAGVSAMFDSETLRVVKSPAAMGASNWSAWVMMVMKPTFLNGK